MKKLICIFTTLALLLALTACSGSTNESSQTSAAPESSAPVELSSIPDPSSVPETENIPSIPEPEEVTVTDHLGNTVTVPRNPQRVAVCDIYPLPSVLTVFFDSADKLVGIPQPSMVAAQNSLLSTLYPEILNAETGYISGSDVNLEELAKLEPDVVFYSTAQQEQGEALRNAGFAAVAISPSGKGFNAVETLSYWLDLLSEIFPENDRGAVVEEYSSQVYAKVQERVKDIPEEERKRIFFLFNYNDSTIMTPGSKHFGQWWADAIGAVNVASEVEGPGTVTVDLEQVYTWNPSLILITNFTTAYPQDLYDNTIGTYDWSGVDAVASKQVYKMPLGMYRSYTAGIDTPVTLYWMAKTVYPELFEDIDVTQECIDYYKTVFGIELTEEQAESIFSPAAEAGAVQQKNK